MKKTLFIIKLVSHLLYSIGSVLLSNFLQSIRQNQALSAIYIFLLAQVVVVAINLDNLEFKKNLVDPNKPSFVGVIHQDYLNHQDFNEETVDNYSFCQEILSETNQTHSTPRNTLINCGLFYLFQEKYSEYRQLLNKAKNLDPNWAGWSHPE